MPAKKDSKQKAEKQVPEGASAEKKASSPSKTVVDKGDTVIIHYIGSFDDGTVFDSSDKHKQLLKFEVGAGQVIKGFDVAVVGMKKDEEKDFRIKPEEGYGIVNPDMVKHISRKNLPAEPEPKAGMMIVLGLNNGQEFPARIANVNGDIITIDLNHPLAGKSLNFKIKLIEIR